MNNFPDVNGEICMHTHVYAAIYMYEPKCVCVCVYKYYTKIITLYLPFCGLFFTWPTFKWLHVVSYRNGGTMWRRKSIAWR